MGNTFTKKIVILFLSLLIFCFVGSLFADYQFYTPKDKISGEIIAHQKEKVKSATLSLKDHKLNLIKKGLNPNNLNAEDCALYMNNPLTEKEINSLAKQGIVVNPDVWVPAVAGKHPYGFHLATVNYDSLDVIEKDDRFVLLTSTEMLSVPHNNTGGVAMNVDDVHNGIGVTARDGTGIKIAVADSGVDLTHADLPTPIEAYDMTDGTGVGTWGASVANTVTDHGTHVSGSVLGDGSLSASNTGNGSGKFEGGAPGASYYFYKIGNDTTAGSSETDEIEAITRAVTVGCDIFTMSYGGVSTYMDGSSAMEAAIDSAVAGGMIVFISAGNDRSAGLHDSISVAPSTTSSTFNYTIDNSTNGSSYTTAEWIRVIWIDNSAGDANLSLACSNLGGGETLVQAFSSSSSRGTDAKRYTLTPNVSASSSKTYDFTLTNSAGSGTTPLVHLYNASGKGTFDSADTSYTVGSPALADDAIAVGAWCHRKFWTASNGTGPYSYSAGETEGTLGTFSSIGPRIDGTQKPDLVAPGTAVISIKDSTYSTTAALTIDNDGTTGAGAANYYVMQGTSMACPLAAGTTALLLESKPTLTPAEAKSWLTSTASNSGSPNNNVGYGLIDILGAIQAAPVELSIFEAEY